MINFTLPDFLRLHSKTPGLLRLWLADLPENWLHANEGKDTFSPFEVVRHLVVAEKSYVDRIQKILHFGESQTFVPAQNFATDDSGKSIAQLLDDFENERRSSLQTIQSQLDTGSLEKTGTQPSLGKVTMKNLLASWVAHDLTHLTQVARVLAKQYKTEVGSFFAYLNILHARSIPGDLEHDWSKFTLRVPISRPVEDIFERWTTRSGIESWFLREAIFTDENGQARLPEEKIAAHDRYAWRWHGWSQEAQEHGIVMENNGKDTLEFSFAGNCFVRVKIARQGEVSIVELTQDNIPTDVNAQVKFHIGCSQGWLFYLTNLKSIMEGGVDLRNKDLQLQGVLNA